MGTGASTLPAKLDKPTAQALAGAQFDEKAFDAAAKDGVVAKEDFLKAAESRTRPTSKCAALYAAFNQRVEAAIAAEASSDEAAKLAEQAFWEEQEREPLWTVPMGDESTFTRHCGLLVALERARAAGKTPLLVDNSEDRVIDTYYSYQPAQILEAKKLVVEERQGTARAALLERARVQLVKALKLGQIVYVRMSNTACDFCSKYSGPDTLPIDIFDAHAIAKLNGDFGAGLGKHADVATADAEVGANLWGGDSPFAAVLREEETNKAVFVPRKGVEVVVCTHFGAGDFAELLAGKLPMDKLQPIAAVQQVATSDPAAACPPLAGAQTATSEASASAAGEQCGACEQDQQPSAATLLAPVEACRQEVATNASKETNEALVAAVRTLLLEVSSRDLAEGDCEALDAALVANAPALRNGLLKALKSCGASGGYARLPKLAEQSRRMLAATPVKGASLILEALGTDVDACGDMRTLTRLQETLELFVGARGPLRTKLGDGYDAKLELPAPLKELCKAATLRAKKRHEGVKAWRRTQQQKAAHGLACVRFEGTNEAFDVVDRHDGKGYTLDVHALEEVFHIARLFDGAVSHTLVQEDVGTTYDVRAWMARPPVVGRDGPPRAPDSAGIFSKVTPDCQFRLEAKGTRKSQEEAPATGAAVLGGIFGNVQLRDEDDAGMMALQCSCQVGKPCGQCAATAFTKAG